MPNVKDVLPERAIGRFGHAYVHAQNAHHQVDRGGGRNQHNNRSYVSTVVLNEE